MFFIYIKRTILATNKKTLDLQHSSLRNKMKINPMKSTFPAHSGAEYDSAEESSLDSCEVFDSGSDDLELKHTTKHIMADDNSADVFSYVSASTDRSYSESYHSVVSPDMFESTLELASDQHKALALAQKWESER